MTMRPVLTLIAAAVALAGCSTTPMNVDCDPFRTHFTQAVPRSPTFAEIQTDVLPPRKLEGLAAGLENDKAQAFADLVTLTLPKAAMLEQQGEGAVLALSGGGQWGAFGAGYLEELNARKALPRFRMVTGVSTGALQALFVGAAQAPGEDAAETLARLVTEYTIADEDEVVHRGGYIGAALRGSVAKLDPLRRKIETALCSRNAVDPSTAHDCPLIAALGRRGAPVVMLGFVEGGSGEMQAVNVSAIAMAAVDKMAAKKISMKTAQQCITAGALASVAMPFFYQQVQITSHDPGTSGPRTLTYYDGGVRQSMFLFESLKALKTASEAASPKEAVYLIRNGPTVARIDPEIDGKLGAIKTAERGYSLIVNQSEVTAIEAIRLRDVKADIRVATADGYDRDFTDPRAPASGQQVCQKGDDKSMFDPAFMLCLQAYGRAKASGQNLQTDGWIVLTRPEIPPTPPPG